jgi:hypothetical protein
MDKDEAYLVGYTIGDGNLYSCERKFSLEPWKTLRAYELCWGDKDREQLEIIESIIKQKFPTVHTAIRTRKTDKGLVLKCTRKIVYQYLERLLEQDITKESDEKIAAYISGFCDAEADVSKTTNVIVKGKRYYKLRIQITQKDKNFLLEIKNLLKERFDIDSIIHKKWKQDAYILSLTCNERVNLFKQNIHFQNPTKRSKLNVLTS